MAGGISATSWARPVLRLAAGLIPRACSRLARTSGPTGRPAWRPGNSQRLHREVGVGKGTNVQARAVSLHHFDCLWRPADVAQRESRILRQGNLNTEVQDGRSAVTMSGPIRLRCDHLRR
jgi:hypothetical protein